MKKLIQELISKLTKIRNEEKNLLRFVSFLQLSSEHKVLEIGCGYGDKLNLLRSQGIEAVGVEVNPDIVKVNLEAGLKCMTVEDFNKTSEMYDVVLMSHIIEHFQPNDLFKFIDAYLDRLKPGGYLIIVTPLFAPYFYDDFDHVKPYHPTGIKIVFETKSIQVQYYARNKLELIDIWFRRGCLRLKFFPGLYVHKYSRLPEIVNIGFALLFRLSFGLIGRTDGWIGLYRKVPA